MSQRILLPPGCYGNKFPDGTRYTAKPGTSITVADHHAAQIATSIHAGPGILSANRTYGIATKNGRWCKPCRFIAQAWSTQCPRCGEPTTEEGAADDPLLAK